MKSIQATLLTILLLTYSAGAMAFSKNSTWQEIFKTKQLLLAYDEKIGGLELKNACLTPTQIKSITDVRHCENSVEEIVSDGDGNSKHSEWRCTSWKTEQKIIPRAHSKMICSEWSTEVQNNRVCSRFTEINTFVADSINVRVGKGFGSTSTWPGFVKVYTFPNCK